MGSELIEQNTNNFLQDAVLSSADVEEFLDELCRHAVQELSDGSEVLCGITLLRDKKAGTVASSSKSARRMDEIQYNYDDGPCLTASREQKPVLISDLAEEPRWPGYADVVVQHGMRSVLAVPFNLEGEAKAAINLYSDAPGKFDGDDVTRVTAFADEAARSLRLAIRIALHSERSADLKAAMDSRTVIDMAVGIVMGQNRCSQDEAIEFLKKASSNRNVKLREVAGQLVAGVGKTPEPRAHFEA
ncbi:GAF and ANTAR domain-containing protein [Arthrobacter monumenti]